MLKLFKKTKFQQERLAATFVEYFLATVDNGFPEVAALVNEAPEFIKKPEIQGNDSDRFLLIALAANLSAVQSYFRSHIDQILSRMILERVSGCCDVEYTDLSNAISKNQAFISKVNHPSKNLVYGMSKAFFHKYKLNAFQEEYFRNVNSPNPVFLKRLDEAMAAFMWNWEEN